MFFILYVLPDRSDIPKAYFPEANLAILNP
jgi:hypothetical protein